MKNDAKIEIDKLDFLLISAFKANQGTVRKVVGIWAERCALIDDHSRDSERLPFVLSYLLSLAKRLGLLDDPRTFTQFIFHLQPVHNWRHVGNLEITDFHEILLSRLDSLFSFAEISELPGYEMFHVVLGCTDCHGGNRMRAWRTGDLFRKPTEIGRIYRVRRVKGATIFYLPSYYGENPPRGTIRKTTRAESTDWISVPSTE